MPRRRTVPFTKASSLSRSRREAILAVRLERCGKCPFQMVCVTARWQPMHQMDPHTHLIIDAARGVVCAYSTIPGKLVYGSTFAKQIYEGVTLTAVEAAMEEDK